MTTRCGELVLRRLPVPPTDIFRPNDEILEKIIKQPTHISLTENIVLTPLVGSHPHNIVKGAHHVEWLTKDGRFISWQDLVSIPILLQSLDYRIDALSRHNPDASYYIMHGHGTVPPPSQSDLQYIPKGIASVAYPHFHSNIAAIPSHHPTMQYLTAGEQQFKRTLEIQSDAAMEMVLSSLSNLLCNFGTKFTTNSYLGASNFHHSITHTFFGFDTLHDAVTSTYELINDPLVIALWPLLVAYVAQQPPLDISGHKIKHKISFRPNALILHPSQNMREALTPTKDKRIWVKLATIGTFADFVRGGISLIRNPQPTTARED